MYVCICNAIREKDFRAAARRYAGNAEAIYAALGHTPQCRQCLDEAEEIISEEATEVGMAIAAAA
ncbi:(2Fe-2S)-binding protein [Novosphingobium mangrovi (ex Huang et al. 2023)]|uniref:(2Fe-2S)-binding protein n=1 Tax=Novosphingobium mangrovi (ex Huang et al. 2023) TaxID=2976432 RepID=A0ABT2I4K7_9SPHN|nr:(2Fe-2S)-binding protein [Novosphingobium mangrovi (ex Huang et al. 2023)]MCT2399743.1 (2Fe-2S)-binding protein [Novosphingobium mangrovi (ex Huang et al. 2023)]